MLVFPSSTLVSQSTHSKSLNVYQYTSFQYMSNQTHKYSISDKNMYKHTPFPIDVTLLIQHDTFQYIAHQTNKYPISTVINSDKHDTIP